MGPSLRLKLPKQVKNVRVLPQRDARKIGKGMTAFAKAFDVKCEACHVKEDYASDEKPAKRSARAFLLESMRAQKPALSAESLRELLSALGVGEVDDLDELTEAIEVWVE
jgi:hypothetical protein